jgi:D-3-phosphoglycerate dehydrogenase
MSVHRILIADPIHQHALSLLRSNSQIEVAVAKGLSEAQLIDLIPDYEAIIVRSKTSVTTSVIEAARQLKVIGRAGNGLDNIDVATATQRGIAVLNAPDVSSNSTAEFALAQLLSLSRNLPQAHASMRAGEWQPARFMGTQVMSKSVGVIGFGAVGRKFARLCLALKMEVLVHDPFLNFENEEAGIEAVTLEKLLSRADYVSLHCPLTERTRHLIDAVKLAQMKPGARLINCARGELIDETALLEALQSGRLAGAALDVYASEPPANSPLLTLDTVVLTPHLGASTEEAQQMVGLKIANDVADLLLKSQVSQVAAASV